MFLFIYTTDLKFKNKIIVPFIFCFVPKIALLGNRIGSQVKFTNLCVNISFIINYAISLAGSETFESLSEWSCDSFCTIPTDIGNVSVHISCTQLKKGYSSHPLSCSLAGLACWATPGANHEISWQWHHWASQLYASSAHWTGCCIKPEMFNHTG